MYDIIKGIHDLQKRSIKLEEKRNQDQDRARYKKDLKAPTRKMPSELRISCCKW